jgi:hypothetical protein
MYVFSAPDTLAKTDCPCIDAHSMELGVFLGTVTKEFVIVSVYKYILQSLLISLYFLQMVHHREDC